MGENYPCKICQKECVFDTIQCDFCSRWIHTDCVPMTPAKLKSWSQSDLQFLCKECCFHDGSFDFKKSLERLGKALSASPRAQTAAAASEKLLMDTYNVQLPSNTNLPDMPTDAASVQILQNFHPYLLKQVYPAKTVGDGNCLFRATSKALTGSESFHVLLRVLTSIEIMTHRRFYDTSAKNHQDLIQDNRIVVSNYIKLLKDCTTLGAYSDMMHIYALSAALKQPIRSYYPPQLFAEFVSEPHTRKVIGRKVQQSAAPCATLMWTQMLVTEPFIPNHFVPLLASKSTYTNNIQNNGESCVMLDDSDVHFRNESYDRECDENLDRECDENVDRECDQNVDIECDESTYRECDETVDNKSNVKCKRKYDWSDNESERDDCDDDRDDSVEGDSSPETVHGMAHGILSNSFLNIHDLIKILQMDNSDSLESIPPGIKSNVYFRVENQENVKEKLKGKKSSFSDDCGVWNASAGASPKTFYSVNASGELKSMCVRKGVFGSEKRKKGKKIFIPFDPQPDKNTVIELSRYYTSLKKDSKYKKRVSTLLGSSFCVVEYLGIFPGLSVHGNSKKNVEYVRTPQVVMSEMSELLKINKPQQVYNKLTAKYDELTGPTSKRQVYDKKLYDKQTETKIATGRTVKRQNIADHIYELDRLVTDGTSIVKSIIRDQGKAPCVILYTDEQLEDIKTLCCSGLSILGVDKTFNLCDMHVTVTCYKQTSVIRPETSEPPIFIGPTFIHDNSDFDSYSNFFNHLKTKLGDVDTTDLVIGSDEEQSLVNAITKAFPGSYHILCTRHLYQNAKQKLLDSGATKSDRNSMLENMFGSSGLIHSDDSICFEEKCNAIEQQAQDISNKFHHYFIKRLKNNLKTKVSEPVRAGVLDKKWTNNNCESVNHVLKQAIDWKSKPLLDLVTILTDLINGQFKDLRRSLVSTGQFRLAESHKHFGISRTLWVSKTDDERQRLYKRLRKFKPKDSKTVTSTDGTTVVTAPRTHGRKIGQRKRKIKERTTTF